MHQDNDGIGSIEELQEGARQIAGHDDFGGDDYLEGLNVVLDSLVRESQLTPVGRIVARTMITDALVSRLKSEAGWARHPEHIDVAIERPIFVSGLTRTGSTALHRLLSADPSHQGLEMWLAEFPQPRPPRDEWDQNEDFRRSDAKYRARQANEADLMKVHFMGAEEVEECWRVLQQTMLSIAYATVAYVPSYTEWLLAQDWTATYARHKKNLQLLGLNDPGRQWVLKSPSHVFAIDAIMKAYPDALIVRTFRDPRTAMASTFSLLEQGGHDMSAAYDRPTIGRSQLDLWSRGNHMFNEARARYNPEQFIDVDYNDFIADPVKTVEGIYSQFTLPFSAEARDAVTASHEASLAEHRRPSHQYTLADFGITVEDIDAKFAPVAG